MPVSLENNGASVTWEQLWQSRLGTIVPVLLGNICISVTWNNRGTIIGKVKWLATCARKPKVSGSSPVATYVQR